MHTHTLTHISIAVWITHSHFFLAMEIINNHGINNNHQFIEYICFSTSINFISCRFFCARDSRVWMCALLKLKSGSLVFNAFIFNTPFFNYKFSSSWQHADMHDDWTRKYSKNAPINIVFFLLLLFQTIFINIIQLDKNEMFALFFITFNFMW